MRFRVPAAFLASAALHGGVALALARLSLLPPRSENVSVDLVEVTPPPPPPEPAPPPPAAAPAPVPPTAPPARTPPPPRKVARAAPPPAPAPRDAPPPPNAAPPPDAAPARAAAPRIGISMEATTSASGIAAPAGNTLYGAVPRTAPEPRDVRAYRADRYAAPDTVTTAARPLGRCEPPPDAYPAAARKAGVEGRVVLQLFLDETGAIAEARILEDPGDGLGPAAIEALRRHCRFQPARRGDEAVPSTIRYTLRWELR